MYGDTHPAQALPTARDACDICICIDIYIDIYIYPYIDIYI